MEPATYHAKIDHNARGYLRGHAILHLALPIVVLALLFVLVVELFLEVGPKLRSVSLIIGFLVIAYFLIDLVIDYRLYWDKREFFRDRWLDIILTVPVIIIYPFATVAGGLLLSIRAIQVLEASRLIRFDLLVIDELIVTGGKLQKVGKFVRSVRLLIVEKVRRSPGK